ncbi:MAG TPA: tRNA 2-thiouridine(34) synthase MnmA [Myxococcota bacterium]|nr:tRNA 2-thiouridine(34) synthase MnmA [Myxococcota bacterium]
MGARVVVGMSGGVDSSVAAALLVEQGFEVIGVTMHLAGSRSRCCSLDDADDARRVAETLGIRFYVANYKDRFREEVMEPFADAYLAGKTPIPCVACNDRFKFSHLLARARALGADAVATGHYARIERDAASGAPRLLRGTDPRKDQSYFLFRLTAEQLRRTHFPIGALTKPEVRERARALGLATAEKRESQEICFVPDGDYARVVEEIRPGAARPGEIVDAASGEVLGTHAGVHHFTVGQRRGLGSGGAAARYVVAIDAASRRVRVGSEAALGARGARLGGVCWTSEHAPSGALRAAVQVRYRHTPVPATIAASADGSAHVAFDEPVRAVSPGQAAVLYRGDELLGGGWIEEALQ